MRLRNKGFSTLEMIIAAGIIMMLGYVYSLFLRRDVVNQEGNQLATQTLSYAKTYAKYLSDVQSGNLYIMGSGDNCVEYNPFMSGNTTVISLADLTQNFGKRIYNPNQDPLDHSVHCTPIAGSYKNQYLNNQNSFRQTPCLGVTKNAAGKLQAFMFYVDNGTNTTMVDYVRNAMIRLNGKGGYIESNGTIRSGGGWSLSASDPRFANPGQCGGTRVSPYSLVINMDQFVEFNDQLSNSVALNRESDLVHQPGTLQNTNTSKTDIYMSSNGTSHQIVLDKLNNISLSTSGSTVTLNNGDFQPDSVQGTKQVVSGSACDASQVGAMAQQADPNARSIGIQQGEAICTDSELICALYGSRYCWLPAKGNTITYSDAAHTGKLGTRWVCPAYAPFMSSSTGYQLGNSNVTLQNITTTVVNQNTGRSYVIPRGVQAIGIAPSTSCTYHYAGDFCVGHQSGDYPCTVNNGDTNVPIFQACSHWKNIFTGECDQWTPKGQCGGPSYQRIDNPSLGCGWGGLFETSKSCTNIGPVMLETVTCTSKLVIQGS